MSRTGAVAGEDFICPIKCHFFVEAALYYPLSLSPTLCKSLVYIAKRKVKATIGTVPLSPMHEKREPGRRNGLLQSSSKSSSFKIEHQIEVVDAAWKTSPLRMAKKKLHFYSWRNRFSGLWKARTLECLLCCLVFKFFSTTSTTIVERYPVALCRKSHHYYLKIGIHHWLLLRQLGILLVKDRMHL